MDLCASTLELLGMVVYMAAWLCALATTLMPQWLTLSTDLLLTESYELGLWETCVVQDMGGMECRPYDSLLGLPQDIKVARIFMCISLAVGLLGLLLAIPGLHLVNSFSQGLEGCRAKRIMKVAGGVLGMVAGVLSLVPVSYVAHLTVMRYFDESVPEVVPRWEFGDALFCGWVGGFLLLVAGLLLFASCLGPPLADHSRGPQADYYCAPQADHSRGPQADGAPQAQLQKRYEVRNTDHSSRKPPEYV
ncbi:putative claudin-24 [Oncorhynchus nerka]|uniref:putative claudin-24 n=1 Tax=Oncorhynchus nerka TaxID=8023 RepID=UPI00112FDE80|nr:putative claudin-24 [Oncorhynchus nerka]